ncbi:DNA replication/repair protein RecF [Pseudomaricurvus sp. HS19]|uniref:DNA replication/repair protein RecF n=1 Tax=Pseudomaricurvus sp. HS19 TaxID=2692626 RepID=UPI00136DAA09|nr:DNA replication/repair protein RecF [Pseudomaricurvus sp. HS19]MYM63776.1 DNA replication/repair protein RecF [Pseudomaricurvus sp. HS19]
MTLRRLLAHDFRNIKSLDIELSPQLNIFFGPNGSGKTSILEAISTLSMGRSFRSRKYKTVINHDAQSYTLHGQVLDEQLQAPVSLGVQRDRSGQVLIKKAGSVCRSAAELAETLPVRVMNGHSFGLLEGGPEVRRQFLDWLVFHVEPEFYPAWRSYEKCLKHRNSLLRRDKIDRLYLQPWDRELALCAAVLDRCRAQAFERLQGCFGELIEGFPGEVAKTSLRYYRGWDSEQSFEELLTETLDRDMELGYTRQGPHRADIRVQVGKLTAVDLLSRGQQKIVVSALLIAQGMIFRQLTGRRCIYLIDDMPAELDVDFRAVLAGWLQEMGSQVFVTGVELPALVEAWPDYSSLNYKLFHVEHGGVQVARYEPGQPRPLPEE